MFPTVQRPVGTNFPVRGLKFAETTDDAAGWRFVALGYGSGDITVKVCWYGDTATSGDVVWEAALSAITPETDSQDVEADGLGTATKVTDSHLGTTAHRLHIATITLTSGGLDSVAANDRCFLRIRRLGAGDAADTLSGGAVLDYVAVSYARA